MSGGRGRRRDLTPRELEWLRGVWTDGAWTREKIRNTLMVGNTTMASLSRRYNLGRKVRGRLNGPRRDILAQLWPDPTVDTDTICARLDLGPRQLQLWARELGLGRRPVTGKALDRHREGSRRGAETRAAKQQAKERHLVDELGERVSAPPERLCWRCPACDGICDTGPIHPTCLARAEHAA